MNSPIDSPIDDLSVYTCHCCKEEVYVFIRKVTACGLYVCKDCFNAALEFGGEQCRKCGKTCREQQEKWRSKVGLGSLFDRRRQLLGKHDESNSRCCSFCFSKHLERDPLCCNNCFANNPLCNQCRVPQHILADTCVGLASLNLPVLVLQHIFGWRVAVQALAEQPSKDQKWKMAVLVQKAAQNLSK